MNKDKHKEEKIKKLLDSGTPQREIAKKLKTSTATISKVNEGQSVYEYRSKYHKDKFILNAY